MRQVHTKEHKGGKGWKTTERAWETLSLPSQHRIHIRGCGIWYEMPPARTHLYPPTLQVRLELLQLWLKGERGQSILISLPVIRILTPVAIETTGVFGAPIGDFLVKPGRHIRLVTAELTCICGCAKGN